MRILARITRFSLQAAQAIRVLQLSNLSCLVSSRGSGLIIAHSEDTGPTGSQTTLTEESVRSIIQQEVATALRTALSPGPSSSDHRTSGESVYVLAVQAHPPPLKRAINNPLNKRAS